MTNISINTINRIAKEHSLDPFVFSTPITDELYKNIYDLLDKHVKDNREKLGRAGIAEIDKAFKDLAIQRNAENS